MKILGWILLVFGIIILVGRILYIIKGGEVANIGNLIIAILIVGLGWLLISRKKSNK